MAGRSPTEFTILEKSKYTEDKTQYLSNALHKDLKAKNKKNSEYSGHLNLFTTDTHLQL